jgi:hypothetical protein
LLFAPGPSLGTFRASIETAIASGGFIKDTVDGVAAFLYQQLRPLWGEVLRSAAAPRPVNLPLTA